MGALRLTLRMELRRRWRPMLMLALLLGLTGGVLALLAVGTLAHVLAGRWAWTLFASSAGLAPDASIPVALVLLIIPVTLALAALIAAWPGRAAARVRPAVVLRAE